MDELVQRLATGEHPVEVSLRPERTTQAFKQCLDRGFVHIRFTETRGGTELGFQIDSAATDLSQADFDAGAGQLKVAGLLTLNYDRVRCVATIDLASLKGEGHLELVS